MALLELLRQSTLLFLIIIIFLIVFLIKNRFLIFNKKPRRNGFNLPPSPSKLPIIGNLHQLGTTNPLTSLHNLSQKYGPIFYLDLGHIPTVIISSARIAKEAFKTNDIAFSSRPKLIAAKYLFHNYTDLGFSPYGPYWKYVRKVCVSELYSAKRVQSFCRDRGEEVARLVVRISSSYPDTINLSKILGLYANDIVCKIAFGRVFTGRDYDNQGFHKLLEEFQELLGGLGVADFFPSMEFITVLTGMKSRLAKVVKGFDTILDRIVDEHLDSKIEKDERDKDFVHALLDIQRKESGEMPLTLKNVKAIILDVFAAGTDTTFITLDWTMTELIINPKAMEKAQEEVRRVVGQRRVVSEEDLPQLNYMKAVIKETLRLHPPAPVLMPRETIQDVTIDGYDIPAETRVFVNVREIGRDPDIWEDPESFKPERFLDSTIDYRGQDFELIPFGAGRRICPGIALATANIELALAQLLHSFDWEFPNGVTAKDLDMTEVFGITMYRKQGLIVHAKPRFDC